MDKDAYQMNEFEIMTLGGLGVFALVMASLVYVMMRNDKDD